MQYETNKYHFKPNVIEPLGKIINQFIWNKFSKHRYRKIPQDFQAITIYNNIKDDFIKNYTKAVFVIDKDLWISVPNSMVANEVSLMQEKIITYINSQIKEKLIRRLFFRIENINNDNISKRNDPIANITVSLSEKKEIVTIIRKQNIIDKNLKKQLYKYFISSLKSQKIKNVR